MAERKENPSKYLTACLCKLQLPHAEEHVKVLQKPIMPTLQLPEEKFSVFGAEAEQSKRVKELLADVDAARAEDLQLQRKLEKDADELLKAYKAGQNCEHWLPRELGDSGVDETTARLKYELNHSRFQLAEVRNQLHTVKRELAAYEKLVRQEIGDNVNLHEVLTSKRWRGRAEEIERLKAEIASMESKAYDHKYMKNPLCIPSYKPRFPDVNDLVPRGQVRVLQDEARKKKELRDKTEKEVEALIDQYGNISLMYKASLTHNKMLAKELKSLKEQLNKYDLRAREDEELVKNLIVHQMQMRQMIDREAHLARLVNKKQNEEADLEKENILDAVKYKALWEATESEKCALEKMVDMLTQRLEAVIEHADEAERHCEDNEARRKEMEEKIEVQQKAAAEAAAKSKGAKSKGGKTQAHGTTKYLPAAVQLEVVKEQNTFLRNFLLKSIETKVEDLKLYQFTMNSIREQYVETLRGLKSPPEATSNSEVKAQ